MGNKKAFINLSGAMDLIKMSKNPLTPIYEAMTNSLESLAQRSTEGTNFEGKIQVLLYFTGLLENEKDIEQIEIIDNGIGFTEENYNRFREFFDKSKGYDNRGTGRLQYFHRFNRIKINSVFLSDSKLSRRIMDCNKSSFISQDKLTDEEDVNVGTTITLCDYLGENLEKDYFNHLTVEDLASAIRNHFLLRFYLDNQKDGFHAPEVKLTFVKAGNIIGEKLIKPDSIPTPKSQGEIVVPYMRLSDRKDAKPELEIVSGKKEVIKWAHFVLPDKELGHNGIYLCSKDIPVESFRFDQIRKNEDVGGNRYLTAFYGQVLDDPNNVSDSVDSFKFPDKKDVERMSDDLFFNRDEEFLLSDSIQEEVYKAIPAIYKDVLDVQEEQKKDIELIARAHGIPSGIISKAKINLSDNERNITRKLFSAQSAQLAEKSYKAKQIFESLRSLDPTSENYQDEMTEKTEALSELVVQQNKEELSRYIIRREMVADLLRKILSQELDYQNLPKEKGKNKDKEGLIHDLIFKRKSENTNVLNDLWILNEEFLHFDGCSELRLNQIKTSDGQLLLKKVTDEMIQNLGLKLDRRPDIFLYASEEKCLIVEFKEPNEDLSNHLNQMTRYCNLIANYGAKKVTSFYCYLIGENINPITDLDGDYRKTINGDWIRQNVSIPSMDEENRRIIANAQIEIIKLSSIRERAHRRNLSFAEKLGIPDLLSSKVN